MQQTFKPPHLDTVAELEGHASTNKNICAIIRIFLDLKTLQNITNPELGTLAEIQGHASTKTLCAIMRLFSDHRKTLTPRPAL